MGNTGYRARAIVLVVAQLVLFLRAPAQAQDYSGQLVHWRPQAEVFTAQDNRWSAPTSGRLLAPGDGVRTGMEGWAAVLLADESLVQLNRNTSFILKKIIPTAGWETKRVPLSAPGARPVPQQQASGSSVYELERGTLWLRNKNVGSTVEINTPTVAAGIRGTEITVEVLPSGETRIAVLEGLVRAENQFGAVEAGANEEVQVLPGQAPVKRLLLSPEQSVQWTLAVPNLSRRLAIGGSLAAPYELLLNGQPLQAVERLNELARARPGDGTTAGLLSLALLVVGKADSAIDASTQAVNAAPSVSDLWLIRSYAFQAAFRLDEAVDAAQKALDLDAGDTLARAQLAKLLFGMDRTEEARELLAGAGGATNGEIENIRGFIELALRNTDAAEQAFTRAIALDPSLGEPHLGLALAFARRGQVNESVESVSRAVVLEPRRSMFLSYWAKILYEQRRFTRALELLDLAEQLDPRDPTPNFYRSVILRDLNQPTEAIYSLHTAIEKNDNRAVYRSRFLLDRDLASRNIDLATLYRQLGLAAWSRHQAIESVKQDYANSSAHLFLGSSLLDLEGRGPAAASETLLASLLQKANLNSFNSYNEYTTFLESPDHRGQFNGSIGNFDTQATQVRAYGAVPDLNFAYAISHFYSTTDGWRNTNFERQNSVIGQAKWDPTPNDSFTLGLRFPEFDFGDTSIGEFEFDSESKPDDTFRSNQETYLLGYHRHLGPNSDFMAFGKYEDVDTSSEFNNRLMVPLEDGSIFDVDTVDIQRLALPSWAGQLQLYHRIGNHQLIGGSYQYWGDDDLQTNSFFFQAGDRETPLSEDVTFRKGDSRFESYYLVDIWNVNKQLTLEAGAYFDHQERPLVLTGEQFSQDEWGPRVAAIYRPTEADTFRLAAFRYLLPFFDERLDPTDIGGITVYRGGFEGTRTDEADLQWEHEWSSGYLSLTGFYLKRQVRDENVIIDTGDIALQKEEVEGHGAEIEFNQLLWDGAGLAAGYRYKNAERLLLLEQLEDDHLAVVQLSQLYPSGLSFLLRETYRSSRLSGGREGKEDIWITDAGIGYELPRKFGTVGCEVRNLFDEKFNWIVDDFVFVGRVPRRELLCSLSYNLNPL